jgi:hypothetical protein
MRAGRREQKLMRRLTDLLADKNNLARLPPVSKKVPVCANLL